MRAQLLGRLARLQLLHFNERGKNRAFVLLTVSVTTIAIRSVTKMQCWLLQDAFASWRMAR
jgi:hypothetical protein